MAGFPEQMITDVVQCFCTGMQRGDFITEAADKAGTYRKMAARWLAAAGGIRPRRGRDLKGRYLTGQTRTAPRTALALGQPILR